ncbi:hypothetical protein ACOALZ_04750 [Nocardiopsis algeriensis]|uniref:hypothetical protein n=1 Tax=Nocardiopsis algeriensis TaxID=1478215 RepID=UPI003B434019
MGDSSLAEQAAEVLVRAMSSPDRTAWARVRAAFAALSPKAGKVMAAELDISRNEVVERPRLAEEVTGEWRTRLRRLVEANPGAEQQLRGLVRELGGEQPRPNVRNEVHGDVSGTVIQAGSIHGGVNASRYGGDHVDFSEGTFQGPATGKEGRG